VRYQRITGFGASSAWIGGNLSEAKMDLLFSPELGLGLSLLRIRIAPDGSTVERLTAERAAARGVTVWAAPWSPPGAWKTNGTDTHGGSLLPEYYEAWADRLSGFAASMTEAGVPLFALSPQNEPNWTADWETCLYTPDELVTFVRDYLAVALARDSPDTRLIAPESANWGSLAQFAKPLLMDPDASAAVSVIATHAYGGTPYAYTDATAAGKELWETEVSYDNFTDHTAALETARHVHQHLAVGGVNAFHYWWLESDTTGSLMVAGALTPQAYGLGHFSKFVRPGYLRVDVPTTPQVGVSTSAYFEPETSRTVIVVVNERGDDVPLGFHIAGPAPLEVVPWVTTATESLARHEPFAFEDPLVFTFASASVTTLVVSETLEPAGTGGAGGTSGTAAGEGGAAPGVDAGAAGASHAGEGSTGGTGGTGGTKSSRGGSSSTSGAGKGGELPGARGGTGGASNGGRGGSGDAPGAAGRATEPPPRKGDYVACSTRANGADGFTVAPLFALLLLVHRQRRRPGSGSPRG
jgi:glucuronoarabinoxylan endo-1,4-beta-xylanase